MLMDNQDTNGAGAGMDPLPDISGEHDHHSHY